LSKRGIGDILKGAGKDLAQNRGRISGETVRVVATEHFIRNSPFLVHIGFQTGWQFLKEDDLDYTVENCPSKCWVTDENGMVD
jgi:hypothetical protein